MRVAVFQHYGRIHTSQIFGLHHVALEPLETGHWCQHVPPCSQRAAQAVARVWEHHGVERCSLQFIERTQKLFKQVFLNKIGENMLCVHYTVLTQARGLVSIDLLCFHSFWPVTFMKILVYILKDTHINFLFLIRKMLCCYCFLFVLAAGARILCSARHSSCSVLLDQSIKNYFSTALISSCLNMMFLSYLLWLLMPSF